jgi:membrane fusion protein, copper/silver efflux system
VREARARLVLLGLSEQRINAMRPGSTAGATVAAPAPFAGVVTKRHANTGLIVEPATELFTVVDLPTVWVIGNLYERDLSQVAVGSPVFFTTPALPGRKWEGRISYIDPQIDTESRTLQVRIEAPNRDEQLRLGMYVDVAVEQKDAQASVPVVS